MALLHKGKLQAFKADKRASAVRTLDLSHSRAMPAWRGQYAAHVHNNQSLYATGSPNP